MRAVHAVLVGVTLTLAAPACAQTGDSEPVSPPPPPPCATDAAPYRDFDFWVGAWDVYSTDGEFAGENTVTLRDNGCLIVEEWSGGGGGTGVSLNFYDTQAEAWRQVWRGVGVLIDYAGGLDETGAMALEGEIVYVRDGATAPFRGRWTPQDDGHVLQEFWQLNAETGEWDTWFVGDYRPKDADDSE